MSDVKIVFFIKRLIIKTALARTAGDITAASVAKFSDEWKKSQKKVVKKIDED